MYFLGFLKLLKVKTKPYCCGVYFRLSPAWIVETVISRELYIFRLCIVVAAINNNY